MSFFKTYFLHFICNIFAFCVQHYNRVIQHAQSAVAGGVKLSTIDAIVEEGAGIIVVGGAICNAQARAEAAKEMKRHLR